LIGLLQSQMTTKNWQRSRMAYWPSEQHSIAVCCAELVVCLVCVATTHAADHLQSGVLHPWCHVMQLIPQHIPAQVRATHHL
jgi:hypothetical protein